MNLFEDTKNKIRLILEKRFEFVNNRKTDLEERNEKVSFLNHMKEHNVVIDFDDFIVNDENVYWGGNVGGILEFVFKIGKEEKDSRLFFNYLDEFNETNQSHLDMIEDIKTYYDLFYKRWKGEIDND